MTEEMVVVGLPLLLYADDHHTPMALNDAGQIQPILSFAMRSTLGSADYTSILLKPQHFVSKPLPQYLPCPKDHDIGGSNCLLPQQ
jgi:hypothetical protein